MKQPPPNTILLYKNFLYKIKIALLKEAMLAIRKIPTVLVAFIFLTSIYMTLAYPAIFWVDTLFDDAYYYLGVAKNIGLGHGSSFALPLETNGYQPLWLGLLAIFSLLVSTDTTYLAAYLHVLSALCALAFIAIAHKQHEADWAAGIAVIAFPFVTLLGMETSLIPALALLFFRSSGWVGGLLASALFLTRLDALALVAGRMIYELIKERKIDVRMAAVTTVTVLAYFLYNYVEFGTAVPISGQAKSVGNVIGENWKVGLSFIIAATPLLIGAFLIKFTHNREYPFSKELYSLLLAIGIASFYYGVLSGWDLWPWYRWPLVLLLYFFLLSLGLNRYKLVSVIATLVLIATMYGGLKPMVKKFSGLIFAQQIENGQYDTWATQNVRDAEYFNTKDTAPIVLAMGDRAGSLGYFLDPKHQLIQTEGLVADRLFLSELKAGKGVEFLERYKVDYLIADRGRYWKFGDLFMVPEPIQGLSAKSGVMLMCFPTQADAVLMPPLRTERKYFAFNQRVTCPKAAQDIFAQRMATYGIVRRYSLWPKMKTGPLSRLTYTPMTETP